MTPRVSIIILNWNGLHLLSDCLSSVFAQTYKDFEVIVVDNGSTDGSQQWITKHYPQVSLVCLNENKGFCVGNNVGIMHSRGEYIVLLNNDTKVEPGWLHPLVSAMDDDLTVAACDSKILYFDQPALIWTSGAEYAISGSVTGRGHYQQDTGAYSVVTEVFAAVACSAIYRRTVLDQIGWLDEDFFAGYEDIDLSFRARLAGYRILNVPESRVYHKVSATHVFNSYDYVFRGQRNVTYVFIKNMPGSLLIKYLPLHFAYMIGSSAYFARCTRLPAFLKAKWAVVKNLPTLMNKRKAVQSQRSVSSTTFDSLLKKDWLASKLSKFASAQTS